MADVPMIYQICVEGELDPDWAEWLEGMTIVHSARGQTTIAGPVRDQAALYGILVKLRDLCLSLISVNTVEGKPPSR